MAKLRISELPKATFTNPQDLVYIVQAGISKSIAINNLLQNFSNLSLTGNVSFGGRFQVINGSGTVDLSNPVTLVKVGSAGTQTITLPRGANGQIKVFSTILCPTLHPALFFLQFLKSNSEQITLTQ